MFCDKLNGSNYIRIMACLVVQNFVWCKYIEVRPLHESSIE
jgi:hypothetical protein